MKPNQLVTPSEFYRGLRPEYFSDSNITYSHKLTKELLAFELDRITTTQREAEFETLCRRLSEKLIAPNLIPQVGPTGGGDGKTDSETFEVSELIANRWFIPENGWERNEKWAFAFSAKKAWKPKVKDDVKKIIDTKRDYTKVYFITNQSVSSKEKRATEDWLKEKHSIEVSILDAVWITESIITNGYYDLIVDSLNLSNEYAQREMVVGPNDARRQAKLDELEQGISNSNRYYEYDFQLFEDAIQAAILSRMLEKPRNEVEGKFDRVERICKKLNIRQQWLKLHYQRAWTSCNWYDDYTSFLGSFKRFKSHLVNPENPSELELYVNLYNLLFQISKEQKTALESSKLSFEKEQQYLKDTLDAISTNKETPTFSLVAKTYQAKFGVFDALKNEDDLTLNKQIGLFSDTLQNGSRHLEYPFEMFSKIAEVMGKILPHNQAYDNLIDAVALISQDRSSSISSGNVYLKRAIQKMDAEGYVGATVYYGKAVELFAKEETQDELFLCLMGLGLSYRNLGLYWASNTCFAGCARIAFRPWHAEGKIGQRVYNSVKELAINELLIGRLPIFFSFHELLNVIGRQINMTDSISGIPTEQFLDSALSVRLMNTDQTKMGFSFLPDILDRLELWLSNTASLYMLGHTEDLKEDFEKIKSDIITKDFDKFHELIANQPIKDQLLYDTEFLASDSVEIKSKILGCEFNMKCASKDSLIFAAETFLSFFESFLSTSLEKVYPTFENVYIEIKYRETEEIFSFTNEDTNSFIIHLNKFDFQVESTDTVWHKMLDFSGHVLQNCFVFEETEKQLEKLFKDEGLFSRTSFIFQHHRSMVNILGESPKVTVQKWKTYAKAVVYPNKRPNALVFNSPPPNSANSSGNETNIGSVGHDKRQVVSVIDNQLWNRAKCIGLGTVFIDSAPAVMILFENSVDGEQILRKWKELDKPSNFIDLKIIKGVDHKSPHKYRIYFGSKINTSEIHKSRFGSGQLFITNSRFIEITPRDSKNLALIEQLGSRLGTINFFAAEIKDSQPSVREKTYVPLRIEVKDAWKISSSDRERVVIFGDDKPLIPHNIKKAPVLEVIAEARKRGS